MDNLIETSENAETKETVNLFALLKFGKVEHLKNLQENGTLFLNSIQALRKENDFRNDTYEGASKVASHPQGTATVTAKFADGTEIPINYINLSYVEKREFVLGNICSFYSISSKDFENGEFIPVDKRMQEFGTHAILITDIKEFFNRVENKILEMKCNCYHGHVRYFDETSFIGDISLFQKRSRYQYQNEYRIYVDSKKEIPITLELGSLKDISVIGLADKIHELKPKLMNENMVSF